MINCIEINQYVVELIIVKYKFFDPAAQEVALQELLSKTDKELWDYRQEMLNKSPQMLMNYLYYERKIDKILRNAIIERLAKLQEVSPANPIEKPTMIISDIDNTFLSSRDPRYESKSTPYPGIRQLYDALLHGNSTYDLPVRRNGSARAFLTARPGQPMFKNFTPLIDKMKTITSDSLGAAGIAPEKQLILWGDFIHCLPLPGNMYKSLGKGKIANFEKFSKLYAGYQFIFFGDNGEADIDVARNLHRIAGANMSARFIHDVKGISRDKIAEYAEESIFIYTSTIDAAIIALQRELISNEQALTIATAVVNETDETAVPQEAKSVLAFNNRLDAIISDLDRLHKISGAEQIVELSEVIRKKYIQKPDNQSCLVM